MNLELFNELWKRRPSQHRPEFQIFLEICEMYLKKHRIEKPIVVELGIYRNWQKKFYEQLLGAEHMGVDITNRRSAPDVYGNTHDPKTLEALKEKLKGRPINILFIDACHLYEDVKKDFEMYSPLCDGIIALHDAEIGRWKGRKSERFQVWRFWDELKTSVHTGIEGYIDFLFFSIKHGAGPGIGVVIKK